MRRRRDAIVATVTRANQPPPWAHALLRRNSWAATDRGQSERDFISKVAVYRDRFNNRLDGLGPAPASDDVRRIWHSLRGSLAMRRREDLDDHRHPEFAAP
jgi:hypothetical protein